jgi:uncharacterized membrane protein
MKLPAKYWCGIIAVLLIAAWLGARKLNADGVWYDEWWSLYVAGADVFHVSRSVGDIWQRISTEDVWQAPLYAYSLSAWGSAVGWTEFATRALSLLAGVIALAGIFRLGWTLSKRPLVGLGAAALLGSSIWFVYFLHEIRVYMLLVMFTVLLLLFYRRIMYGQREPRLWHFVALGLVSGLLINTHYFAVLVVGVISLWHLAQLIRKRPDRRWSGVMAAGVLSGLMLIPWLTNVQRAVAPTQNQARITADLALLLRITGDSLTAFSNAGVAVLIILLALSLLARPSRWVWLLGIALLLLNLAGYYIFGLIELRYNMAILPFLALLAGFGLDELAKRRIPAGLIIGIWLVSGLSLDGNFQMDRIIQHWPPQPIREMAQALKLYVAPDDVIVNIISDEDRSTLAAHSLVYYMGDFGARIEVVENNLTPSVQTFAARMQQAAGDAQRLWVLRDPRWMSSIWGLSEYVLNAQNLYHCTTLANAPNMQIWGFGRIDPKGKVWQYGDGIRLSLLGTTHLKDGLLQVWLGYQTDASVPANTYSIGVHVTDASGQARAQFDEGLPTAGTSCQAMDIAVSDLAAGDYQLKAAVYNWQTSERLMSIASDGTSSDLPMLGTVTISAS